MEFSSLTYSWASPWRSASFSAFGFNFCFEQREIDLDGMWKGGPGHGFSFFFFFETRKDRDQRRPTVRCWKSFLRLSVKKKVFSSTGLIWLIFFKLRNDARGGYTWYYIFFVVHFGWFSFSIMNKNFKLGTVIICDVSYVDALVSCRWQYLIRWKSYVNPFQNKYCSVSAGQETISVL